MFRILCLCMASALLTITGYAQIKRSVLNKTAAANTRRHISEEQAKQVHLENLSKEGKTKFRSAYKRTDFETTYPAGASVAINAQKKAEQVAGSKFSKPENKIVASSENKKEPKFISGIEINRNR